MRGDALPARLHTLLRRSSNLPIKHCKPRPPISHPPLNQRAWGCGPVTHHPFATRLTSCLHFPSPNATPSLRNAFFSGRERRTQPDVVQHCQNMIFSPPTVLTSSHRYTVNIFRTQMLTTLPFHSRRRANVNLDLFPFKHTLVPPDRLGAPMEPLAHSKSPTSMV